MKTRNTFARILCAMLTVLLLCGLSAPAFAAEYPDIEGHWAKDYILDLVERGLMTGYSDGTMRPSKQLSAMEAVALLSRLYTSDLYALDMDNEFGELATAAVKSAGLSWGSKELATALGVGIITEEELASLKLSSPIEKELLAVFLARAMQLAEQAESFISVPLSFTDVYDISSENRCYVYALVRIGVITGTTSGKFSPRSSVDRAVMATMLSRAIAWLEDNGGLQPVKAPEKYLNADGLIVACGNGVVRLMDVSGVTSVYPLAADCTLSVDGVKKTWSNDYVCLPCRLSVAESTGEVSAIRVDSSIKYICGNVVSFRSSRGERSIGVDPMFSDEIVSLTIVTDTPVYKDSKKVTYDSVSIGDFVIVAVQNETVLSLRISDTVKINGTIKSITYGDSAVMIIEGSDCSYICEISPSKMPTVTHGSQKIDLARLKAGDEVEVTISSGIPTAINITGTPSSVSGRIQRIATVSSGSGVQYTLTVELTSGVTKIYEASSATPVYTSSGISIGIANLKVDDIVNISLYSDTVVEITKTGTTAAATANVTGTVVSYDAAKRILTLNVEGAGWVFVDVSSSRCITLVTGINISLSSIKEGASVTVYGSCSDLNHYTAVVVYEL